MPTISKFQYLVADWMVPSSDQLREELRFNAVQTYKLALDVKRDLRRFGRSKVVLGEIKRLQSIIDQLEAGRSINTSETAMVSCIKARTYYNALRAAPGEHIAMTSKESNWQPARFAYA